MKIKNQTITGDNQQFADKIVNKNKTIHTGDYVEKNTGNLAGRDIQQAQGDIVGRDKITNIYHSPFENKTMNHQKTILIAAANPSNETRLRLDIEVRDIKERLNAAKHRDWFELKQIGATRVRDLQTAMQEYEPTIVHFCGHGAGEQGIILENNDGTTQFVKTEALANFFQLFEDELECVVLNACFSEIQAQEIVKHIPYVIGMQTEIGDKAAIEFAVGFYGALASGKDYEKAFKFGCVAIELMGIPESLTPQLFIKEGYSQSNIKVKKEEFTMSSNTDLRQKKLFALEKALILETDASVKFKLENEIAELKQQIANSPK